jgi:Zn-dependent protease with chaperone function
MTAIIRRSPRRWWFYFWLVSLPMMVFLVFIAPLVIDPLFNQFEPLTRKNPQLVEAIERVVQRGGLAIPPERMYEMKASAKVTTLNAYVTGFGASKRVVVWDTSIQKLTTPEILFMFGHEMGHYVLHHILKGLIAGAIGAFIGLYILFYWSVWLLQRFGPRWRILALHDWAAIPMIFLLAGIMSFFAEPVGNLVSRYIEHQADVYGLEVTHNINVNPQQVAAHSFQVLGEMSLDYPYPGRLAVFWYWTHPPIADRVRFAQEYDPWAAGEEPQFVK